MVGVTGWSGSGQASCAPLAGVPGSCGVVFQDGSGPGRGLVLAWPHIPLVGVPGSHEVIVRFWEGPGSGLALSVQLTRVPGSCKVVCQGMWGSWYGPRFGGSSWVP